MSIKNNGNGNGYVQAAKILELLCYWQLLNRENREVLCLAAERIRVPRVWHRPTVVIIGGE